MKDNLYGIIGKYGYDSLAPVVKLNELAGFPKRKRSLQDPDVQFQMGLITEEYLELQEALQSGDAVEAIDAVGDIIVVTAGLAHRLGVDPNELMYHINESNASKFCNNIEDAHKSVASYEGDRRYRDVHTKKVGNLYVIYGRKEGSDSLKILKGIHYQPPTLSDLV